MKKPHKITVVGPRETWTRKHMIDTTSKAKGQWSTGLSPFHLGPVKLYDGHVARIMENGWQYCKVYPQFVKNNKISKDYLKWAKEGWDKSRAVRYPMGKGKKPLFALWENQRLDYVISRAKIYFRLYATSVLPTTAFKTLLELHRKQDIVLWDYDGYDHRKLGKTLTDVLNDPTRIMGHAFVLFILLELLDRKREKKEGYKLNCSFCNLPAGAFYSIPFYKKDTLEVSCHKCKEKINPKYLRNE